MSGSKHSIIKFSRFITVFLALAYNLMLPTMFGVRFIQHLSEFYANIEDMAQQLTVFGYLLLSFATHFNLLLHHKELVKFFEDFKKNLAPMNNMRSIRATHEVTLNKICLLTYFLYFIIMILFMVVASMRLIPYLTNANTANFKDFISILTFTIKVLRGLGDVYASFFTGLADIIPIFIYYHAAIAVEMLVQQWQSMMHIMLKEEKERNQEDRIKIKPTVSVFEEETRQISRLYDSIVHFVSRTDHLFGHIMILSKGLSIFVICTIVPTLIDNSSLNPSKSLFPYILTVFIFRLVWPIFMLSKLYTSTERLRAAVLSFQFKTNLNNILPSEEKAVKFLLIQLKDDKLAASPLGLYSITPSTLLHILSIVLTYIIILLQSNNFNQH